MSDETPCQTDFWENVKVASLLLFIPFFLLMLVVIFPLFLITVLQVAIRAVITAWTYWRYKKKSLLQGQTSIVVTSGQGSSPYPKQ